MYDICDRVETPIQELSDRQAIGNFGGGGV